MAWAKLLLLIFCLLQRMSPTLSFHRSSGVWSTHPIATSSGSLSFQSLRHSNKISAFCNPALQSITRCYIAPKPSGIANTKDGKAKILERTQKLLQNASAILAAPIKGVNMEQIDMLRKALPPGTIGSVVKNSLMRISVQNTPFAEIVKEAKDEIMYFFVPEGLMKKSYDAFQQWSKEVKRTEPDQKVRFVALDNALFKDTEMEEVVKLPPKKELIAKIAWLLTQIPLRLALDIRAIPEKLGFAMHEIKSKLEQQEGTSGSVAADSSQQAGTS